MRQLTFEDLPAPTPVELLTPGDIYLTADEALLRQLIEDRRFEKKAGRFRPRELGDYVSMWANTAPTGGLIVLGIRDDTIFEGMHSVGAMHVNEIEKCPNTYCPDARFASKRIRIHRDSDGAEDYLILFQVDYHETRVVRTSSGDAFMRLGDSKHKLTESEIRVLQADKGEIHPEREEVKEFDYPDGYHTKEIAAFAELVRREKCWADEHSTEDILELLRLGNSARQGFRPNLACALLFAKDPQLVIAGSRIRFLRFDGEVEGTGERWNAVKDITCEGTVIQQIQQVADVVRSQLRTFSRLGDGGKFFTADEYPEHAWYEAVVNACAHRSYGNGLSNMTVFVKMFDDRLVVESPGPLPPFVTPENIYDISNPRNPRLMEALRHFKIVKAAHEGTRRMRDSMSRHGLPAPEFEQSEVGGAIVRVTLRNNLKQRRVWIDADVASLVGARLVEKLNEDQKRYVNFMAEHGSISVTDALRLSTVRTWHTAKNQLMALVEMGIAEYVHRTDLERDPKARFVLQVGRHDAGADNRSE